MRLKATARRRAGTTLTAPTTTASSSARGRPAGQVWLVRLRRGPRQAIVAVGLDRPSADDLARRLRDVIDPPD